MSTRPLFRRLFALGMAVVALAVAVGVASPSAPAATTTSATSSALPEGVSVTATPTTGLIDGQRVAITVKSDPDIPLLTAEAQICRAGVVYKEKEFIRPDNDGSIGGPNCPDVPISSSANLTSKDPLVSANAGTADGETFTFKVGTGSVEWLAYPSNEKVGLTCDESSPCALVVQLQGVFGGVAKWVPYVFDLQFRTSDPIAGCGGVADGALSTASSDRLTSAWIDWTVAACKRDGAPKGAPTKMSFLGEGPALEAFADGRADLAYSAAGFDPEVALTTPDLRGTRGSVAVPIGLNAVVLAVAGGITGNDGHVAPYKDLELTTAEVATLVGQGQRGIDPLVNTAGSPLLERNPELKTTGFFGTGFPVGAYSTSEATSWFGTEYLRALAPDAWHDLNGVDRGADASLALAEPSYQDVLQLFTGRPSLEKALLEANGIGGSWLLTDLATARAYGLSVVAIENAAGEFVVPTDDAMLAALPTMTLDGAGVRIPNPEAVGAATVGASLSGAAATADPYPLTFVEYAIVPTGLLVDSDCQPRTASQAVLEDWLGYITGDGQSQLPEGMLPLTDDLKAEATAAIAQVGSITPDCLSQTPAPAGGGSVDELPPSDGDGGGDVTTTGSGSQGPAIRSATTTTTVGTEAPAPGDSSAVVEEVELASAIPEYAGSDGVSTWLPLLALAGIVGLTTMAAVATSAGRRRPASGGGPVIEIEEPGP